MFLISTASIDLIRNLREQGFGYKKISAVSGLPLNTVKTICRRYQLKVGSKTDEKTFCRQCGKPVRQTEGRKVKLYCCDRCRAQWWNSHRDAVRHRNIYHIICPGCGKVFDTPLGTRKYCSRSCSNRSQKRGVQDAGK